MYPNPVSNHLIVSTEGFEFSNLTIKDLNGKVHSQQQIVGNRTELNVSALSSGIYLIEIATENAKTVKRFVKE